MSGKLSTNSGNKSDNSYEIILEQMDDGFIKGTYDDVEVIVMESNGFMNATRMIKTINRLTGLKKKYNDWLKTYQADEIIEEVTIQINRRDNTCGDPNIFIRNNGSCIREINGVYVHPLLIIAIALWTSYKMGIRVQKIVSEYMVNKERRHNEKVVNNLGYTMDMLKCEVSKREHMKKEFQMQKQRMGRLEMLNEKLLDITEDIYSQDVNGMRDIVTKHTVSTDTNTLMIIKTNMGRTKGKSVLADYYIMRVASHLCLRRWNAYKRNNKRAEIVCQIHNTPNAIRLWRNIVSDHMDDVDVNVRGNNVYLHRQRDEKKFVRAVKKGAIYEIM
jgi:hypothetical protein